MPSSIRWPAVAGTPFLAAAALVVLGGCHGDKTVSPEVSASAVEASHQSMPVEVDAAVAPDTLVAIVVDANNQPVSGAPVTWAVVTGTGTVSAVTTTSASDGTVTTVFTPSTTVETDTVTATAFALTPAPFSVSVTTGPAATVSAVSGNGQLGQAGTALAEACVVRVTDGVGNTVANAVVTWRATGGGTMSAGTATTNAAGQASATLTLGSVAGVDSVTATVAGLAPVTFIETGN